jgi:hypothetical protein
VMGEGTWVGLDVHARKVVAGVLDAGTGEVRTLRVQALPWRRLSGWAGLPAPVRVACEAGPAGYGLARCVCGRRDRVHGCGAVEDSTAAGGSGEDRSA